MSLIDICFNFTHDSFRTDEKQILDRAKEGGVAHMIIPGSSVKDTEHAIVLSEKYSDMLFATAGVHPHLAHDWTSNTYDSLKSIAKNKKIKAIGETGLDYNRNYSTPQEQKIAFEQQLQLAVELDFPLFLHQRDAHADFLALVKTYRKDLGNIVVHCFTAGKDELYDYLDQDLYIGITGWICDERRGQHLHALIKDIPINRLLLETDAPYLLPRDLQPKPKTRRNEPCYLTHIAAQVARCRKCSIEELSHTTVENTYRLFDIEAK